MSTCFGKNLKTVMRREGMSLGELVTVSGVSQASIDKYIYEDQDPIFSTVILLMNALEYDIYLCLPNGKGLKYSSISKWLDFITKRENITLSELANKSGVHYVTILKYHRNSQFPKLSTLKRIVKGYGYTIKAKKNKNVFDLFEEIDIWKGITWT